MHEKENNPVYWLSIKYDSGKAIFDGRKKYEFRKKVPKYPDNIEVLLYAIDPTKKVIGEVTFDRPIEGGIDYLCSLIEKNSFNTCEGLRRYFKERERGFALPVLSYKEFNKPITLGEIKKQMPEFVVPNSFLKLGMKYDKLLNYLRSKNQ